MLIRYADDAVLVFENKRDAERVWRVIGKRFATYGLRLHPEKTRLVEFSQPARIKNNSSDGDGSSSFDLLGFTHYWGKSRRGRWVVKRKTAKDRLTRALRSVRSMCRWNRHMPVREQHRALCAKLRGHYYGITGNMSALTGFWHEVKRAWRTWLNRRSGRNHLPWSKFDLLHIHYPLPRPRIVHSALRPSANP